MSGKGSSLPGPHSLSWSHETSDCRQLVVGSELRDDVEEGWWPTRSSQGSQQVPTSVRADIRRNGKDWSSETTAGPKRDWSWLFRPAALRPPRCMSCCNPAFPGLSVSTAPTCLSWTQGFLSSATQCRSKGQPGTRLLQQQSRPRREGSLGERGEAGPALCRAPRDVCCHLSHPSPRL